MAHYLSNFQISHPIPSQRITHNSSPSSRIPQFLNPNFRNEKTHKKLSIKAEAGNGNGRDNLDHLQRAANTTTNQQQQPQRIKKRVPQSLPIGLWDRFPTARTVQQMLETMERIMDEPVTYGGNLWAAPSSSETAGFSRGRTPWEIMEGEGEYKMRFDMPGMTKEDVKVWVEEKMLVVKGEKESKEEAGGNGGEWSAKSYGKYSSRIALPENVEFEKIRAEVKDGVLYISIPKASTNSKVLDINVE